MVVDKKGVVSKSLSLLDKQRLADERLRRLEEHTNIEGKKRKEKKLRIKVPAVFRSAAKKDPRVSVCLWLSHNKLAEFKKIVFKDGLLYVGENSYFYDERAIYSLKQGFKRLPLVVVKEDRLIPVGGVVEEYKSRVLLGGEDEDHTLEKDLHNHGQQTIIRGIEQAELDKDKKKGKGGSVILWIILGVAALYLVAKVFGVA